MHWRTVCVRLVAVTATILATDGWAQPLSSGFVPTATNGNGTAGPSASNPANGPSPRPELTPEMRGDIYMARKMYREAAEMYQQMPADKAVTWNKVGIAHHQMMQLALAKKYYERSVKLNPHYAEAINNLGTIAYAQKNYRRATSYYKKALANSPDSASILSNLGTAYFSRKKYELAVENYQKALAIDPNVFEHRGSAGTVLQERSVEERAKFHYHLAKIYAKSGQNERALQYLRKALEEGVKEDRAAIAEDDAFSRLRQEPEFQLLMKTEFRVL